ncbi:MAG: hypothetical protein K6G80_11280, partial [Treponema sp.]|nr:hypothetical protein [Treponema sp.]
KTGSLRLALYLPEKEYTGGELGNKIAQLDIASQGLESGYGWKESTVTTDMSYIPPKGTYYPVIAILEYAKDAEGNGVWYVCSNNYVTFKPVNWNPGK